MSDTNPPKEATQSDKGLGNKVAQAISFAIQGVQEHTQKNIEDYYRHRATMRRHDDEMVYAQAKLNGTLGRLADAPSIRDFEHWRTIDNAFPYTVAYQVCHMLVPRRLVANEDELTLAELEEFRLLKRTHIRDNYDQIMENMPGNRSVLDHYHVHLVVFYDKREEMGL